MLFHCAAFCFLHPAQLSEVQTAFDIFDIFDISYIFDIFDIFDIFNIFDVVPLCGFFLFAP